MAGIALFVAAMAIVSVLAWQYAKLQSELDQWQADWQRLQQSDVAVQDTALPEEQERLKTELRFANRVIEKLDRPWDALFAAVEGATGDQSALLGIEPDPETRQVHLTAEAKSFSAMLDYLKQVRQSPVLQSAYLVSHQINQQDPQKPVRFTIDAPWADPGPTPPGPIAQMATEPIKP